jgi:hypothetical protein
MPSRNSGTQTSIGGAIEGAPDDVGELRGPEAVRRHLEEWNDVFDNMMNVPEELVDLGDERVLDIDRNLALEAAGLRE